MPSCRLDAHTFIFQQYGFDPVTQLEKMLSTIADSGFGSVELTNSSLGSDGFKSQVQSSLNSTGLELIGASHGMPLWNLSEYKRNYDILDEYSDRLSALGENLKCGLSCSGKDFSKRSEAENDHLIQAWIEVSEMFRSKDLELNYHNHGESQTDIAFVLDNVSEDILPMGPDLDWLRVGHVDPIAFIKAHPGRLSLIHLRAYKEGGDRTAALGEGDVDYAQLSQLLDEVAFEGDLVVELALPSGTRPDRPVAELLQASRDHIRETMGL